MIKFDSVCVIYGIRPSGKSYNASLSSEFEPALYPYGETLGLWLRLKCSLDSLSIDSAHVIYVSEGYDVAYNRRTASQPSHVVLRVTWYVKTFRNVNYVC